MKIVFAIIVMSLSLNGCATMGRAVKATEMDKPEARFAVGGLIAVPGFIAGACGFIPGFWAFGVGWALGMSGAIEGCARQGGCYR